MSRAYAQVFRSIWADQDFRDLEPGPQRLYLFLLSQENINWAGVLVLSPRRWASRSKGYTEDDLMADLGVLVDRRYVLVDEDEQELLVRTYIRNDGLWRNPKTMKSAHRDAMATGSRRLRRALIEELERLQLDELPEKTRFAISADVKDLIGRLHETLATPSLRGSQGVASPSEPRSYGSGVGAGVGAGSTGSSSVTLGQDRVSENSKSIVVDRAPGGELVLAEIDEPPPPEPGSDDDPDFVAFWCAYPRKEGKPSGRKAWRAALKRGADPQMIIKAAERVRDDPQRPRDPHYIKLPAGWLNDERYVVESEPDQPRAWDDYDEVAPWGDHD